MKHAILFVWILLLSLSFSSCIKDQIRYNSYNLTSAQLGVPPEFNKRHTVVSVGSSSYMICGMDANSQIVIAKLDSRGNGRNILPNLGTGSAQDIIPIFDLAGSEDAYLATANKEDDFFVLLELDTIGNFTAHSYESAFFDKYGDQVVAAESFCLVESDNGFLLAGRLVRSDGKGNMFAMEVAKNNLNQVNWLRTYGENRCATSIIQDGNHYWISGIADDRLKNIDSLNNQANTYIAQLDNRGFLRQDRGRTLFNTIGGPYSTLRRLPDGTIVLITTRNDNNLARPYVVEPIFDGNTIQLRTVIDGLENQFDDHYAYEIVNTQEGGYALYGLMERNGEIAQFLRVVAANGNDIYYHTYNSGAGIGFPGDVTQAKGDGGLFAFSVTVDADGNSYHFVKTDEIGEVEEDR